jgi:hypothetical protein
MGIQNQAPTAISNVRPTVLAISEWDRDNTRRGLCPLEGQSWIHEQVTLYHIQLDLPYHDSLRTSNLDLIYLRQS